MKTFIITTLLYFFCSLSMADSFILHSIKEAQQLSQQTNKPMLLIFGGESCKFCSLLKNDLETSLKENLQDLIVCYIDIELNPSLKKEHNITVIPDSRLILNQKTLSTMKGYQQNNYKKWLQDVK